MVFIPLITFIPPRISRLDVKGAEIGQAYQLACIESWKRAGFGPVSVNWKNEPFKHALRMIPISRSASAVTGCPHVFFADLLAVASIEAQGRPFALMNAEDSFLVDQGERQYCEHGKIGRKICDHACPLGTSRSSIKSFIIKTNGSVICCGRESIFRSSPRSAG
jgi:hypothetical protein